MRLAACLLLLSPTATFAQPSSVASLVVDLRTGTVVSAEQPAVAARAILPGSVMKVVTIAAALDAGIIDARSGIVCGRSVVVDGHRLTCTHPDLHRPLTPAEALAHSCNSYVASVAARLPRAAFDRALAGVGLPPSDPAVSVQAAALGLEGNRVTPRGLIDVMARVGGAAQAPLWAPATLEVVRDGLRRAAREGTAAALGAAGIDALAKTGTVDAGGVSQGLVVGVTPSEHPTTGFALLVSGGAGVDAASLVAARLRRQAGETRTVRVGIGQPHGGYVVQEMSLEAYVAGVIAGESAAGSAPAALDALAIAVRTYTLANKGRHAAEGFDLCDLTHCQALRAATQASSAASARTAGRYLADGQAPAEVFYTASCGGYSERPSAVWRGAADPAFLPSRPDGACGGEPSWQSDLAARDLLRALRTGGFSGETIRNIAVTSRTASGRVAWLHVDGLSPADVSGENLRTLVGRTLGWQQLRSTLFNVTRTAAGFRFAGHGAGHGVGLCVLGAANRARAGASTDAILHEYYPGLALTTLAASTSSTASSVADEPRIVLPAESLPARAEIRRLVSRSIADLQVSLGAAVPASLVLTFHPTVESYQRVTGLPWFTAGATRGSEISMLPLPVLRQRQLLESTIRHELAHAITGRALDGAPMWVYEGVAVWAEGDAKAADVRTPGGGPMTCPADSEFKAAASSDALRRLYERAAQCYARELAAGRSWRTFIKPTR